MIIKAGNYEYFLLLREPCPENEFISAAKVVPRTPAAELVSRAYCCLFNDVTDITAEYQKYYAQEYPNIWAFLYWHYSIDGGVIASVREAFGPSMHLLYGNVHSGGDYRLGVYIMSEEGFPFIKMVLKTVIKEQGK